MFPSAIGNNVPYCDRVDLKLFGKDCPRIGSSLVQLTHALHILWCQLRAWRSNHVLHRCLLPILWRMQCGKVGRFTPLQRRTNLLASIVWHRRLLSAFMSCSYLRSVFWTFGFSFERCREVGSMLIRKLSGRSPLLCLPHFRSRVFGFWPPHPGLCLLRMLAPQNGLTNLLFVFFGELSPFQSRSTLSSVCQIREPATRFSVVADPVSLSSDSIGGSLEEYHPGLKILRKQLPNPSGGVVLTAFPSHAQMHSKPLLEPLRGLSDIPDRLDGVRDSRIDKDVDVNHFICRFSNSQASSLR